MTQPNREPLPSSMEAEQAVLGSILIDPTAVVRAATMLKPSQFYDQRNTWIYQAVLDLYNDGIQPDSLAILDRLEQNGKRLPPDYIVGLVGHTPTSMHMESYARIVVDRAERRELIKVGTKICQYAFDVRKPEPMAFAHKEILDLGQQNNGHGLCSVAEIVPHLYDQVEAWSRQPLEYGQVRGTATHMPSVDYLTEGLEPKTLILLAGRPSIGKSAMALEIARRVGMIGGKNVAVFELEMGRDRVLMRWASAMSGVESRKIKRGACPSHLIGEKAGQYYANRHDMEEYLRAIGKISQHKNLAIDDTPGLSASQIRSRAMQYAHEMGKLGLIVVDHSTIMASEYENGNTSKIEGRKSEVLKNLAKELDCPVLLVQQLSRATEGRQEKRPALSDLRDSGEHEQNADVVLGLYRESYYRQVKPLVPVSQEDTELEVIGLKSREGPTGTVKVRYEWNLHRFSEFERKEPL